MNLFCFVAALIFLPFSAFASESVRTPHVTAEIRAETKTLQAGLENWVGIRLDVIKHWHIYWRNPGDSGLPTRVQWILPKDWEISDVHWPIPEKIELLPLVNYGYEGDTLLGFKLKVPKGSFGKREISAKVSWLVCKESCIPEKAELNFTVDVSPGPAVRNPWALNFDRLRSEQPQPDILQPQFSLEGDRFDFAFSGAGKKEVQDKKIDFFPYDAQLVKAAKSEIKLESNRIVLSLGKAEPFNEAAKELRGILTVEDQGLKRAYELQFPLMGHAIPEISKPVAPVKADLNLVLSIFFGFLGGIILNLMPCVFPVLGIKVMSLVNHHGGSKKRHGEVYTLGVLISFWVLTAMLLSLRSAGQSVGWGFQLQQPGFVIALIFLFTVMSANLAGLFEFGGSWMGAGAALASKDGYIGTFFTGVLAVIVATPCTAPFMGAAIGAALSQPAWGVFLIFTSLGLGLAFPFLLLSLRPSLLKFLPRPGAWMERLKQLLSIPMFLTVVWLVWVVQRQLGDSALYRILWALVVLSFALFIHRRSAGQGGKFLAILFLVSSLSLGYSALQVKAETKVEISGDWQPYSEERLAKALSESRPVFIDFTAAWCLTCQVNEKVILEKESVRQFFREKNILLLKGDWTNSDPLITAALERYGRIGVPVYIVYAKGAKEAKILPQILNEKLITESY